MSEGGQETPIRQAMALLQDRKAPDEVLAVLAAIGEDHPNFAQAQHLRGVCAVRKGEIQRGVDLYVDAIRRGERTSQACQNLALATADAGYPDIGLDTLLTMLRQVAPGPFRGFASQILQALNLADKAANPGKVKIYAKIVLPLVETELQRRRFDNALWLEAVAYEWYAKSIETEEHFAATMGPIEPLMTAAGRAERALLPPLPAPPLEPPYRVAFFLHNASMLAHVEVLLNALKGYRRLDDQPFEPTVYCFAGKSAEMEAALAALDVPLVMLNERFPEAAASNWERLLKTRDLLAAEGVQEVVWVSLVMMMPLAFGLRMAPVQTWWAMKWRNFSQPDIDGYLSGSRLSRFGQVAGREFRMTQLGADDWYDAGLEGKAAEIRAQFPDKTILMTLARTEKMLDPAYLGAICEILKARPDAVFLWAGREPTPTVVEAFRRAGVIAQTHFVGWVNSRLYAQVCDVFLDSFPFPCGFTLFQAMAAGKPVVLYDSPEAAQTGVMTFIKPLFDGDEGSSGERAELRSLIGEADAPLMAIARDPADYVRLATRLAADPASRAEAGAASQAFMARYFSDPATMGRSMADHLVELIELKR